MPIANVADGLHCISETNPKTGLSHYTYFLKHGSGNLIFHPLKKTAELKKCARLFDESGGIKLQLLTHDAEASSSCDWVHERYGAGLYLNAADTPHLVRKTRCPIAKVFSGAHRISDDLEAIPLTGHTLGFTAFRLVRRDRVFLFIGDFLVPRAGLWVANVRKVLMPAGIENLKLLKKLEFDFLLPNKSKGPLQPPFRLVGSSRETAIDKAIRVLERKRR
jgi:glyoxylase-like metal-dependent hydrolase (beta-lactamase superfamily II)